MSHGPKPGGIEGRDLARQGLTVQAEPCYCRHSFGVNCHQISERRRLATHGGAVVKSHFYTESDRG